MAAKTRRLLTNFSKGELSPLLEGRPDLEAYFEGCRTVENFLLMRQGGLTRRPGTRFIAEVKDSTTDTILLPFEASVDAAYIIEAGDTYLRFYRNQARVTENLNLITNGTFDSGITGWDDLSTAPATSTWHAITQSLELTSGDAGAGLVVAGHAEQAVVIADTGSAHTLRFTAAKGFPGVIGAGVRLRIGTTSGGQDLLADTTFGANGETAAEVTVTPGVSPIYIGFRRPDSSLTVGSSTRVDDVSLTKTGGTVVEIATPYVEADLRALHMTQSVDVAFLFHPDYAQRRLARASDTDWALSAITYRPPPSFEADTDIGTGASAGADATLTPAATTGTDVAVVASQAVFLTADVGRQIIAGAARALITGFGVSAGDTTSPNTTVRCEIVDAFASTDPIAAGDWRLRGSPQTTLDAGASQPVGAPVDLATGANAFRAADVGKFLHLYGGVIQITSVASATSAKGEILSDLSAVAPANPDPAAAGTWTLEVASWSAANGFPRTGEFFQGRLFQASTAAQPTTVWGSASDDFENYAAGTLAEQAIEVTIASRQLNRIEWLADNLDLFLGTSGSELQVTGGAPEEPLGGDVIPLVKRLTRHGSAPIQPVVLNRRTLFLDRSRRKLLSLAFAWEEDGFDAAEVTAAAEHITEGGVALGPVAFATRPDPRLYLVRSDGTLVTLTLHYQERVVGFTRLVTDGAFEAVAVIPKAGGGADEVWVIVRRTINGATKRYVEVFDPEPIGTRAWGLQTDAALVYTGASTTTITGLDHLEGMTVAAIANGSYVGTFVVSGGSITLPVAATEVEVGLPYTSTVETMRPAVEGQVIEGLPRSWDSLFVRLHETIGGTVNGEALQYEPSALDEKDQFTGDRKITGSGWDTEGRITVTQTQPYPMTLLALFGTLSIGDHD